MAAMGVMYGARFTAAEAEVLLSGWAAMVGAEMLSTLVLALTGLAVAAVVVSRARPVARVDLES